MKSQILHVFQNEVACRLKPLTGWARGNVGHIDGEIKHVTWLILDAAQRTLLKLNPKKVQKLTDGTLFQLCTKSNEVRSLVYKWEVCQWFVLRDEVCYAERGS